MSYETALEKLAKKDIKEEEILNEATFITEQLEQISSHIHKSPFLATLVSQHR